MLIRVIRGKNPKPKLLKFVPISGIRVNQKKSKAIKSVKSFKSVAKKSKATPTTFATLRLCEKQKEQSDKIRVNPSNLSAVADPWQKQKEQKQKRSPNQSPNKYRGPKQTKLMFHLTKPIL